MERRLLSEYFEWTFDEKDDEYVILTDKDGRKHKLISYVGIDYPYIVFNGRRYYFY